MSERTIIAKIHTEFPDKFGVPRQSGLVEGLRGTIVFEPEYRNPDAIRGIDEFSHLWLLWNFSQAKYKDGTLTVCPPRLGGKVKKGVFATRSPFRPNSIGLSSVKLEEVRMDEKLGPLLVVSGADLMDGTPIYDIKPYLAYTDSHAEATGSFGEEHKDDRIAVIFPRELREKLPKEIQLAAIEVLEQDPRAAYNKKPDYIYGMGFAGYDIRFTVADDVLTVCEVVNTSAGTWSKVKGADAEAKSEDDIISGKLQRMMQQFRFFVEIDQEKEIFRQTYLADGSRKENDAEHAWHMAIMTILLSEYANEKIDVLKTVTMLLIHDIVEIDAGDTYAYDPEGKKTQREREEKAAQRIFHLLPEEQGQWMHQLWEEFEAQETPEAKFARVMDNIQPMMLNDAAGGKSWAEHQVHLSQILKRNERTALGSEAIWDYAKEHFLKKNIEKGNIDGDTDL